MAEQPPSRPRRTKEERQALRRETRDMVYGQRGPAPTWQPRWRRTPGEEDRPAAQLPLWALAVIALLLVALLVFVVLRFGS